MTAPGWTARGPRTIYLSNVNSFLYRYTGADGIKTGYTARRRFHAGGIGRTLGTPLVCYRAELAEPGERRPASAGLGVRQLLLAGRLAEV